MAAWEHSSRIAKTSSPLRTSARASWLRTARAPPKARGPTGPSTARARASTDPGATEEDIWWCYVAPDEDPEQNACLLAQEEEVIEIMLFLCRHRR